MMEDAILSRKVEQQAVEYNNDNHYHCLFDPEEQVKVGEGGFSLLGGIGGGGIEVEGGEGNTRYHEFQDKKVKYTSAASTLSLGDEDWVPL